MTGIVTSSGDGRFQWTIEDFLSVDSSSMESPGFNFRGGSHSIRLFSQRDNVRRIDMVELHFNSFGNQPNELQVKLGMGTGMRGKQETRCGKIDRSRLFHVRKWMPWSEILERRCEILRDGCLTINCELTLEAERNAPKVQDVLPSQTKAPEEKEVSDSDSDSEESVLQSKNQTKAPEDNEASDSDSDNEESVLQSKSAKKVLKGLKNLLTSAEGSDVVIKIEGKEFPAHRAILGMRSPVFNSMFNHETVEKETGVVDIEDCDPLTFPDFLSHVYTGSTKHICAENALSLYTASDKYCMAELKEACALFMKNNFSVDTFCDVIALALRHSDDQLMKSATKFFCKAATEIIKTPKWHKFLHENTIAGNELFDKALSNAKNI